ncbi:hypothetical protein DRP53_06750 [candidate division WOR-3 bacterium]|uniref:Tetratricopeptide repeat protein n=1 Tax=candidate division WOR-3 bacterium TaxID=2052148 RepID=A0A660SIP2_UNCW3|nr:MAG: hypothetical protein DRP53_06750 [candidate division WOR-3 bacterium]
MLIIFLLTISADSLYLSYLNFSRGFRYEQAGNYRDAIHCYEKAKAYFPENYEIDYYIARAFFLKGDYQAADQVIASIPRKDFDCYQLLGDIRMKQGDIIGAVKAYQRALQLKSDDFLIFHLATILESMGKLHEALNYYEMIREANPEAALRSASIMGRLGHPRAVIEILSGVELEENPDYYLHLGIAHDQLFQKDSALSYYRRFLRLDSTNLSVLKRVIDLYIQLDSLDAAESFGAQALKVSPHDPDLNRSLGYLYYKKEDYDRALDHFLVAVGINHTDAYANYYIGRIFFERKQYHKALGFLKAAIAADPNFEDAHLYLGLVMLEGRKFKEARRHFYRAIRHGFDRAQGIYLIGLSKAMEGDLEGAYLELKYAFTLNPKDLKIISTLANVCDDLRRYDEAMEYFQQVIELDSTDAVALNYVGYTYAERGESLQLALHLVERALEIDSTNGYYIDSLGWIYFKMGRYERALKELLRAKEIIEDAVILEHLGDVYLKLDEPEKAEKVYRRALELDPENEGLKKKLKSLR